MKKLLLILLCVPLIGFSQIDEDRSMYFDAPAIGLNSSFSTSNIFFGLDISMQQLSTRIDSTDYGVYNISYGTYRVNYTRVDTSSWSDTFHSKLPYSAMQFLKFGWATNIDNENKVHDFSFSLIELIYPLHFSPLKFGSLKHKDKKLMWYYKPEIGIGLYGFEIFYSYNLFFKKYDAEYFDGQNMLNLRFSKQF